jgi:hypothetical protein
MQNIKDGFMQEPRHTEFNGKLYHLEDIITHEKSGNKYQIKEIQTKGFIAILIHSPAGVRKAKVYLSFDQLNEYKL